MLLDQPRQAGAGHGVACGQDGHGAAACVRYGRFDGGFNGHNGQGWKAPTQLADRQTRDRVTSHHHGFNALALQKCQYLFGAGLNEGGAFVAIGRVARIGHVVQRLVRQQGMDGPQHRQAAHAGIKYPNRCLRTVGVGVCCRHVLLMKAA